MDAVYLSEDGTERLHTRFFLFSPKFPLFAYVRVVVTQPSAPDSPYGHSDPCHMIIDSLLRTEVRRDQIYHVHQQFIAYPLNETHRCLSIFIVLIVRRKGTV